MDRLIVPLLIAFFPFAALAGETETPKPFNLAKINSAKDEDEPHSTVDGRGLGQIYFTCDGELYSARHDAKGWQAGQPYKDLPVRGDVRSVFVHFAKSGVSFPQTIFYATNSDAEKPNDRGNNFDIYSLRRNSASGPDFTVPAPLHSVCTPADEMHPWLTSEGKLYFSRKTKEGWRVFVARRGKPDQPFEKPVVVEIPVGFHHTTLTPDGKTMYLEGPLPGNRWGLFRSTQSDGKWSEPEELKSLNNAEGKTGDRSPNLSRSGSYLYFASDRPGGKGGLDIWYVSATELGKPK